jgi:DNA-binding transcriptional regulator YbjK
MKKSFSDRPLRTLCVIGARPFFTKIARSTGLLQSVPQDLCVRLTSTARRCEELEVDIQRGGDRNVRKDSNRVLMESERQVLVEWWGSRQARAA